MAGASESNNGGRPDSRWSEEHDRLPLKQRVKILFAQKQLSRVLPELNSEVGQNSNSSVVANDAERGVANDAVVKKVDDESERLRPAGFAGEQKSDDLSSQKSQNGQLKAQVTEANLMVNATVMEGEVNPMGAGSFQQPLLSKNDVPSKVKLSDKSPSGLSENCKNSSSGVHLAAVKVKTESPSDIFKDFENVPLIERQRMLLSSQKVGLTSSSAEGNPMQLSSSVDNVTRRNPKVVKEKSRCASKTFPVARNQLAENQKNLNTSSKLPHQGRPCSLLGHPGQQNRSTSARNMTIIKDKDVASSFKKKFSGFEANVGKRPSSSNTTMLNRAMKKELDENKAIGNKIPDASLPSDNMVPVKYEYHLSDDSDTDALDHMLLSERMKLYKKAKAPRLKSKGTESSGKVVLPGLYSQPSVPEPVKRLRSYNLRKRRRTATDSVEMALDEDAPGLLQALVEQGVSVDEIKLYGQIESEEALDDLSVDDNFTELESVIAKTGATVRLTCRASQKTVEWKEKRRKYRIGHIGIVVRKSAFTGSVEGKCCQGKQIFSQRTSLLKLDPLRCGRGEKPSYCLACLFSLVEQARYLQFRNWPVEWGWTRDLQSFIFVFERHNRIVLERPEYGYATYFFELVDSLPIDWQIKRLVIAMKLTSCSRVTLIENKALEVGEDLTEGEAKVLMEYGWIPNTGLGSMLNYCDRVVHDRKSEKDTSEWRSKIGKMLADGYNGGTIVSTDLPRKAMEHNFAQIPEIKLEVE